MNMIRVIVFDFDGTLVESNRLKYEAFFRLFPDDANHKAVVRQVLAEDLEASRYVILKKILLRLKEPADSIAASVERLAGQYNDLVVEGAKTCPQCSGAERILRQLSADYALYLSSTTPEEPLRDIIQFRRWTQFFTTIFGYPRRKAESLREILEQQQVDPSQVLVVGDGESDHASAQEVGCEFFSVNNHPLSALTTRLKDINQKKAL